MPRPSHAFHLLCFALLSGLAACRLESTEAPAASLASPAAVAVQDQGDERRPADSAAASSSPGESPAASASSPPATTSSGSGSGGGSRPMPTPTPTLTPTPTPQPTSLPTPTPGPTARPTSTPSPAPTATPTPAPTPSNIGSSGGLSLASTDLEGLSAPLRVTVVDAGANRNPASSETVTVLATSEAEGAGEIFTLSETAPNSGVFVGAIPLARRFNGDGSAVAVGVDGHLSVYAEGGKPYDALSVAYGANTCSAGYTEPPSTLTGIVRTQGAPRVPQAGALLVLSGPPGFEARRTVSRSDGSYAFYEVPSGTYWLTTAVRGSASRTVSIVIP